MGQFSIANCNKLPSGNLTWLWKWPMYSGFPIKNGDFPELCLITRGYQRLKSQYTQAPCQSPAEQDSPARSQTQTWPMPKPWPVRTRCSRFQKSVKVIIGIHWAFPRCPRMPQKYVGMSILSGKFPG